MLRGLLGRLRRRRRPALPELKGRPAIRREKVYAADSGYVYHYTYEGYRRTAHDGAEGNEFVFECTSDRSATCTVSVFAPDESFDAWEQATGRELNQVERYAVVKMRLFEIFDASAHLKRPVHDWLDEQRVERQVTALDL